jgi:tellurite resistance protein TerC
LYFAVSGVMKLFRFINIGLSIILIFVGGKMLATYFGYHVPIGWSLSIIATVLGVSIGASVLIPVKPGTK